MRKYYAKQASMTVVDSQIHSVDNEVFGFYRSMNSCCRNDYDSSIIKFRIFEFKCSKEQMQVWLLQGYS